MVVGMILGQTGRRYLMMRWWRFITMRKGGGRIKTAVEIMGYINIHQRIGMVIQI
jgi:hypothetical protein